MCKLYACRCVLPSCHVTARRELRAEIVDPYIAIALPVARGRCSHPSLGPWIVQLLEAEESLRRVSGQRRYADAKMKGIHRIWGLAAVVVLTAGACSPSAPDADALSPPTTTVPNETLTTAHVATSTSSAIASTNTSASCQGAPSAGVAWESDVTAQAVTIQDRTATQPGVDVVVYPRPDYTGRPWSQWGQGIILDDGRMLSAIGDHHGADGNSYLYEYDPETHQLTRFADALGVVGHEAGEWGFGKVHAQMVEGACGDIYLSTYWGSRRGLNYTENYQGDVLLRIDSESRTVENLGVILPEHGVASMASWPEGGLIYAEAADPFGQKTGSFVVLDMETGDIVFEDDDPSHGGYRSIAVDAQGRAYITWEGDGLARYDPVTNTLEPHFATMPGQILRWATPADGADTVYAVSRDPAVFFSIGAEGDIKEIAPAQGYTTSMALAPDGDTFYYVPDAHGGAWQHGTSLIAVDTATGEETVVVELNPLIEPATGLRTGGTYNVVVDPSGDRVYVGLNAGDPATRDTFGEVVLAIVTLP